MPHLPITSSQTIAKALIVVAVYSVSLITMGPFGIAGIIIALMTGTSISGVIILARRENINEIKILAVYSMLGGFLGSVFLSDSILYHLYGYDHGLGLLETEKSMFIGGLIGVFFGAFIANMINRVQSRRNESKQNST